MKNTSEEIGRFSAVMWGVAENSGGKISKEGLRMRFQAMQEFTIEQITQAGTYLLKNREKTFPAVPTTKEFIDAIQGAVSPQISPGARAELQADIVLKKLRSEGRNGRIDFENPITFDLMTTRWRYNSWASEIKEADLVWWRKEFISAYKAYSEEHDAKLQALPGSGNIVQLQNLADNAIKKIA